MPDPKDQIIGCLSTAITKLIGEGAAAAMRTAGRMCSQRMFPDLPSGKSVSEAGAIMAAGIKSLGAFGDFKIVGVDNNVVKIEFKGCYFSGLTAESGMPQGQQAICHFGFGIVEETLKRLTGSQAKVELVHYDGGKAICHETATPR